MISCFKEGKKCKADLALLGSQIKLFNDDELHKDHFEISPEQMVDAALVFNESNINEDEHIGHVHIILYSFP